MTDVFMETSKVSTPEVVDKQARETALDPTLSLICEAPAGSGKTELLTQRFLRLLARVEKPEEILAITFTRKAAGEMRERILKSLHFASTQPEPQLAHEKTTWMLASEALKTDAQFRWNLIKNPNRLQISTFDSVCAGLANALPWHSNFISPPEVLDDASEVYCAAARAMIDSVEMECAWQSPLKTILVALDNNTQKLERLFITILQRREAWLPLLGSDHLRLHGDAENNEEAEYVLHELLHDIAQDTIERICEKLDINIAKIIVDMVSFAAHNLQGTKSAMPACENLNLSVETLPGWDEQGVEQWKSIVGLFFTSTNTWRKTVNKNNGFPAGENAEEKKAFKEKKQQFLSLLGELRSLDGLTDLFVDVMHLPNFEYDPKQSEFLFALFQVLPTLSAMLTVEFRQRNSVDFSEISLRATDALGELEAPSDLALALDYKIRHVLVDEFQDTSPSQIRLLTRLTSGWEPGDGRTLFCVGDAMQSIYGFRGANVGLFLHCLQHGLGDVDLTPIKLRTNFRSQATVVEWVNDAFSFAFPQVNNITDGAVSYSTSQPFNTNSQAASVTPHLILTEAEDAKEHHDNYVVKLVEEAIAEGANTTAILVRSRGHVARIANLLQKKSISFRAVDLDPLSEKTEIGDLIALTQALLSPANRVAWLSVLRAPWCGLSLADLECVSTYLESQREDEGISLSRLKNVTLFSQMNRLLDNEDIDCLSEEGAQRLIKTMRVLNEAVENSYRKPLRQWVEGTWLALSGPATFIDTAALNNTQMYFELLESMDDGSGMLKEDNLQRAVERLFASPDPHADDSLQIMTIHKSKGLEFDTVIIPALDKQGRSDDPELLSWYERVDADGSESIVLAPMKASGSDQDSIAQHVQYQLKKKSRYESCRLLYVACTRAKRKLHLVANASKSDKGEWKSPGKNSLLSHVFDFVLKSNTTNVIDRRNANEEVGSAVNIVSQKLERYDQSNYRLPLSFNPRPMREGELLERYIPFYGHDNEDEVSSTEVMTPSLSEMSNVNVPTTGDLFESLSEDNANDGEVSAVWASHVGTVAHELLHNLARLGWRDSLLDANGQRTVWSQRLMNLGVNKNAIPNALNSLLSIVEKIQMDTTIRWMIEGTHDQLLSEFPVRSAVIQSEDDIRENVIDLVVVNNDTTWLIDFKTSAPLANETEERFVQKEKQQYIDAMGRYTQLLTLLGYKNIVAGLYFPSVSRWAAYTTNEISGVKEAELPIGHC